MCINIQRTNERTNNTLTTRPLLCAVAGCLFVLCLSAYVFTSVLLLLLCVLRVFQCIKYALRFYMVLLSTYTHGRQQQQQYGLTACLPACLPACFGYMAMYTYGRLWVKMFVRTNECDSVRLCALCMGYRIERLYTARSLGRSVWRSMLCVLSAWVALVSLYTAFYTAIRYTIQNAQHSTPYSILSSMLKRCCCCCLCARRIYTTAEPYRAGRQRVKEWVREREAMAMANHTEYSKNIMWTKCEEEIYGEDGWLFSVCIFGSGFIRARFYIRCSLAIRLCVVCYVPKQHKSMAEFGSVYTAFQMPS